jgi:GNAT superfamily N-acetyltransferase
MMLVPGIVSSVDDLRQILDLQHANLRQNLDTGEMSDQGFVTLQHSLAILEEMHRLAPGIVVKDGDRVIGYALTETKECRYLMPDLEPMFVLFDGLTWKNRPVTSYSYYVMGQICIAKEYRGRGVFGMLYEEHRRVYGAVFDLFLTEISTSNLRSLRAHEKVGFRIVHTHRDEIDEWNVVGWDWE